MGVIIIHLEQAHPDDVYNHTTSDIKDAALIIVDSQEEH
jgi:hypothetical protein